MNKDSEKNEFEAEMIAQNCAQRQRLEKIADGKDVTKSFYYLGVLFVLLIIAEALLEWKGSIFNLVAIGFMFIGILIGKVNERIDAVHRLNEK